MQKELLLIIPAYNEEENIERIVSLLQREYKEYDYVIINDGSRDRTSEICEEKGYECLDLPVNLGLAGAFQTGLKYADKKGYHFAIQFDADGQHRPEYIAPMLEEIKRGKDIVIGSRFLKRKKESSLRMLGSRLLTFSIRLTTKTRISDPTSGMRMFSRNMIREFAHNMNYGPEPDTIAYLLKKGARVSEVPVEMNERWAGESYLNLINSMKYMIKMMISILLIQNFRR